MFVDITNYSILSCRDSSICNSLSSEISIYLFQHFSEFCSLDIQNKHYSVKSFQMGDDIELKCHDHLYNCNGTFDQNDKLLVVEMGLQLKCLIYANTSVLSLRNEGHKYPLSVDNKIF